MDREQIEQALGRLQVEMEAPECQGLLTGLLVAKGSVSDAELQQALQLVLNDGDLLAQEALAQLRQLLQATQGELADVSCDFQPLLADEGEGMEMKLEQLAIWVQGFLMGLARGGVEDYSKLPDEAAEFARDMVEMARVTGYELEEDEEANEESYMELVEYLRTGVLLMNELLHPTLAPPLTETPTLH